MAGLRRSSVSVRRQGSSGYVWDDKFLAEVFQSVNQKQDNDQETAGGIIEVNPVARTVNTVEGSRSNGRQRGYRVERVSPPVEPLSPKVSACWCCGGFGNKEKGRRKKTGKRRSR